MDIPLKMRGAKGGYNKKKKKKNNNNNNNNKNKRAHAHPMSCVLWALRLFRIQTKPSPTILSDRISKHEKQDATPRNLMRSL